MTNYFMVGTIHGGWHGDGAREMLADWIEAGEWVLGWHHMESDPSYQKQAPNLDLMEHGDVLVAKQMLESGQFLFPHRGIELYPDKPPLFFWILAACKTLLGSWRWSFLLPSLLSGLGVLWLVQDLGKRLWNHRAGLWAAIAVLSASVHCATAI